MRCVASSVENALHWITDFHIDVLRLDAIQMVFDNSARPFLREVAQAVHAEADSRGRPVHLVAETNQNDVRQILPVDQNGMGLDGIWNDDFHHSLHALLTDERISVYRDHGTVANLAKAYREGFVLSGQYSVHHRRSHGSSTEAVPGDRFVVFAQNHDQIGNRLYGDRLSQLVSFEQQKLAAATVLLAPCVPLLFMGEEYGDPAPFLYFVDFQDRKLQQQVREGRTRDFHAYLHPGRPVPDPTDPQTFERSRVQVDLRHHPVHHTLWRFYQRLLMLRASIPALASPDQQQQEVWIQESDQLMGSRRWSGPSQTLALFHFGDKAASVEPPVLGDAWIKRLDSAEDSWSGPGSALPDRMPVSPQPLRMTPHSVALYESI